MPSLPQTVCWDFADVWYAVSYVGRARLPYAEAHVIGRNGEVLVAIGGDNTRARSKSSVSKA
jgi:hypothetical protein